MNETEHPLVKKLYKPILIVGIIVAIAVACMPFIGSPGDADPKSAGAGGLWVNFLGHFHPLMLHLPIGALVLVITMELLGLLSGGKYKPRTTLAMAFAAATAVLAVVFGYFWYLTGGYSGETVEDHKRDGVIFTVLVIIAFLFKYTADVKENKLLRVGYLPFLLVTGGMMMSAGHHGGKMSHGDPLNELPSVYIAEREAKANAPVVVDPDVYQNIVHNILENKCIDCHGEDKQKGDLRLDSLAAMLEGGAEEDCLVPGEPKQSFLLTSLDLPEDDDMHMPPKEKPQITPEEKLILTWWVNMGAPEGKKLSELEVPADVQAALATLKSPEELAAEAEALRMAEESRIKELSDNRARLNGALTSVNEKFPGSLRYQSQKDTSLTFSAVSYRKSFEGADLDILNDIAADVTDLDLSSTTLTDASAEKLKAFINLQQIKLNGTKVTDKSLSALAEIKSLRKLNLYGTEVSDAGIKALENHPTLEKVYLWNTKVTDQGAKALEAALKKAAESEKDEEGNPKRKPQVILGIKS